jgi:Anthrone oxygenase
MSEWFAIPMLFAGGLFAGGVTLIALERIPAWRAAELSEFLPGFAHTLRRVDRVQPALLVLCLVSTIGFALGAEGTARTSALLASACFLTVLAGSVAWLVPIQRRLVSGTEQQPPRLEDLRSQWLRGHWIRTVVALIALSLAIVAALW